MTLIVLLSGPVCSGKSQLAHSLAEKFEFQPIRTRKLVALREGVENATRSTLRKRGDLDDGLDDGQWLVDSAAKFIADGKSRVCIDRIRKVGQLKKFREKYGWQIIHVHLKADATELSRRFDERKRSGDQFEDLKFVDVYSNDNQYLAQLEAEADLSVDTHRSTPRDILVRVASRLKLYAPPDVRCVDVLVGGQYGSEGKGQVAAYLAREYQHLLRVGGPNAGHSVMSESGKFVYHMLPSGCRDTKGGILIGAGAVIHPKKILDEIRDANVDPRRIKIDPDAMIIEDNDIDREVELTNRIGSTGQGVGLAAARRITDRGDPNLRLAKDVPELRQFISPIVHDLETAYHRGESVLLEGTQGSGLSIYHGEYPHVTSRDTNVAGCLAEAGISPARVRRIVLVTRTYPIRVANPDRSTSGNLSQEIELDVICKRSGVPIDEAEKAERTSTTGRKRRFAEFDWYMFRKACALNAPTDIALTFADYICVKNRDARRFDQLTAETINFVEELERMAHAPVSLVNTRFDERSVIDRRNWGRVRGDGE